MLLARDQLHDALSLIRKIAPSRSTMPILEHVLIEPAADSRTVAITATNLDLDLTLTLDRYDTGETLPAVLRIQTLWEIISKCQPGSSVALDNVTGDKWLLTYAVKKSSAGASCQLPSEKVTDFPNRLAGEFTRPQILSAPFVRDIQRALSHASTDESRYFLNSVYLHMAQPGVWHMVGTDGRRMFRSGPHRALWLKPPIEYPPSDEVPRGPGGPVDGDPAGWLLPAKTVEIFSQLDQPLSITFSTSNRFVRVTTARARLTSKVVEGNYPAYKQVLKVNPAEACDGVWTLAGTDHEIALALIDALPKHQRTDAVILRLAHGHLVAEALDPSGTVTRCGLPGTFAGQPKVIGLNRHYLRDLVAARPAQIRILDGKHPVVAVDLTGAAMVLMPLRDKGEEEQKQAA